LETTITTGRQLIEEYKKLCPDVEKVYVVPNIYNVAEGNVSFYLFHKNLIEDRAIQVVTSSFLSPVMVFRKLQGEKSLLHHHWVEFHNLKSFLNIWWKIFWIILYKSAGGNVIWSIHNKIPHEKKYRLLNKIIRRWWSKIPDYCREARDIMASFLAIDPQKFFIIAHPPFPVSILPKGQAVEQLYEKYLPGKTEREAVIFLMFGYIAAVKRNNEKYFTRIAKSAEQNSNIIIINRHIPDEDVAIFFSACDYALFNFHDILNSGGVELALSYRKKMILPHMGCLKELEGGNIIKFDTQEKLGSILKDL
jgi:hypothetical protein